MQSLHERAASEAVVSVGFLAAISLGQRGEQLAELGALADAGAVGFSDDGRPVESAGLLRRALQYASITGRVLSLHCEELTLTRGSAMHEGAVSALLGITGYPSIGESLMVARDLRIARYEGQPIHLCHLHVRESVEEVRQARALRVDVSAEASPHHLLLTDEDVRSLDPNLRMSPPLASEDDRHALIEALRDGTIDCVATDHAPHAPEEKDVPFEAAANGTTGLETAFPALYRSLVEPGLLELATLVSRMTSGPARAFGLAAPRIAVGEVANLALWDLEERYVVAESDLRSRSRNNAFLGREVTGRCRLTLAAGQVAHRLLPVVA
jgi:dihydroorotase